MRPSGAIAMAVGFESPLICVSVKPGGSVAAATGDSAAQTARLINSDRTTIIPVRGKGIARD
jgi:hypothetical protein